MLALFVVASLGVFSSHEVSRGTVVTSIDTSRYGRVLVVGGSASGPLHDFPLYEFSGDVHDHFGCGTTKTVAYDLGAKESVPLTCTGPERDLLDNIGTDDWPALTTKAPPVAGRGVRATLLGTVYRRGIGEQVTYAGHPLYLFDPSSTPFTPQGENFMETGKPLPPWHGYWYLVGARSGAPAPGVAKLESARLASGERVLAVLEDGNVDPIRVTVYSSKVADEPATCSAFCSRSWTPVLTNAPPHFAPGVSRRGIGTLRNSSGLFEVTFDGAPLYLYDRETVKLNVNDLLVTSGSGGNGVGQRGPGGVMSPVPSP